MSAPDSSRWVAKQCRSVWQPTGFAISVLRAAYRTARCRAVSCRWWRRVFPVVGRPKDARPGRRTARPTRGARRGTSARERARGSFRHSKVPGPGSGSFGLQQDARRAVPATVTCDCSVRTELRRHRIAYRKRSTGSSPSGSGTSGGGGGAGIRIVLTHS